MLRVAALFVFPVKSLRGHAVEAAAVEPWGLAGDRRFLVVDSAGRFLTQREVPRMATVTAREDADGLMLSHAERDPIRVARPAGSRARQAVTVWRDDLSAASAGEAADAWLSAVLERPCRLVFMDEPEVARPVDPSYAEPGDRVSFADGFPLLLTTDASLRDLNDRLAAPVPMARFRPNLVVEGAPAWAEDGWSRLRVGPVLFDSVKPCARCIMITTDQLTGERHAGLEPIRTLQRFRRDKKGQVLFGQNLVPRTTGTIAVGDTVSVEA